MKTEIIKGSVISQGEMQTSEKGNNFINGVFETLPVMDEFKDIVKSSQKYPFTAYNNTAKKLNENKGNLMEVECLFSVNSFEYTVQGTGEVKKAVSLNMDKIKV